MLSRASGPVTPRMRDNGVAAPKKKKIDPACIMEGSFQISPTTNESSTHFPAGCTDYRITGQAARQTVARPKVCAAA